jgi:hypothetical protein
MKGGSLPANTKRLSALRRVHPLEAIKFRPGRGNEGDVCAFELASEASPITVEETSGRMMELAPGDIFLATPGYREARRWTVGTIPKGGLVPGDDYWVLSDSGVVGELRSYSALEMRHLGRVRYLGLVSGKQGEILNIRQFAVTHSRAADPMTPIYLILGTTAGVGKTTAGLTVLRALRLSGVTTVVALKGTGTSSLAEIARYRDFGATEAFDCIDFGIPTTYPVGRPDIGDIFARELDFCLSLAADALVVECAGDPVSANAPEFLQSVKARCTDPKVVLAAADALGALGAKHALADMGLGISLITGPCTDTPTLRQRTEALCDLPAINLFRNFEGEADITSPVSAALQSI